MLEEGKWTGAASGGGRDAQSSHNDVIAEERLVGGAALPNGAVGCRLVDGAVVVVVGEPEERRFARAMLTVSVGADSSGGRTADLLKGAASVVPSCNIVLPPGRGVARRRGELQLECCSF